MWSKKSGPGNSTTGGSPLTSPTSIRDQNSVSTNGLDSNNKHFEKKKIITNTYDTVANNTTINQYPHDAIKKEVDNKSVMKSKLFAQSYIYKPNYSSGLRDILKPMVTTVEEADRPKCLEGTRVDLLQQIRSWAESSDSPNIFLLTGDSGTGKSTVARTIAEEFGQEERLGSYIYFEKGKTDSNTVVNSVIKTIAYGLAKKNPVIAKKIYATLTSNFELGFPSSHVMFENLVHIPLLEAAKKGVFKPSLIILDALDECGPSHIQEELAGLLGENISKLPSLFRFLVTTRQESSLESLLQAQIASNCKYYKLDRTSTSSRNDILKFVNHKMWELGKFQDFEIEDKTWKDIIGELGAGADGVFVWASVAISYISNFKLNRPERLGALVNDQATTNKSLSRLYEMILENESTWDDLKRERFRSIFSLILFGKRWITNTEIDVLLELEIGTTCAFLPRVKRLIHHVSLYEYLVSSECVDKSWYIDEGEGRMKISLCCFEQMRKSLHFNICELEKPFEINEDVSQLQKYIEKDIPSSLQYVCQNWALHLQDVPYSDELHNQLHYFAYNTLLYWAEVLSFTGYLHVCLGSALRIAINWLGVS